MIAHVNVLLWFKKKFFYRLVIDMNEYFCVEIDIKED